MSKRLMALRIILLANITPFGYPCDDILSSVNYDDLILIKNNRECSVNLKDARGEKLYL